jgi:enoyl-CoA hydratase/carnithine racemase
MPHVTPIVLPNLGEGLSLTAEGPVLSLRFRSPAARNALDGTKASLLAELVRSGSLASLLEAGDFGAFLLRSDVEGVFVSGGDVKHLHIAARENPDAAHALTGDMRLVCAALSHMPVPTFSLLEGAAYGGGAELALATDFRIGVVSETFAAPMPALHFWQSKWAVPGGWHGMERLGALCPSLDSRRVSLLFAAARSLGADELWRMGLLDARFATLEGAAAYVDEFARGVRACPDRLRADLLARDDSTHDAALFQRHWLGEEHRTLLAAHSARAQARNKSEGNPQ